ncbi:DUF397 domain-containing protein [Actinophytocola glycyrrhizae]|uniref:DUF397 domain-containing protein n=1 Tax=Actinophytocola glycyrrhizae TaxID=2044873 RepID=A0ABV9S6B7_9PSEU
MTARVEPRSPWRKSSFSASDANCVEIAFGTWRKSSFSAEDSNCVEVAFGAAVRDSKNPGAGHLALRTDAYRSLVSFARRHVLS